MLAFKTEVIQPQPKMPVATRTWERRGSVLPQSLWTDMALLTPATNLTFLTSRTVREYQVCGGLNLLQRP